MRAAIIRQDKVGRNEQWALDIEVDLVTLTAPNGWVALRWTASQAVKSIEFPSFSKSIKYTGFFVSSGTYHFQMNASTLRELKTFVNRGIVAHEPKAVSAVLRNAILTLIGGFIVMALGCMALIITVHELVKSKSDTDGSPHRIGLVTGLVGFAIMCRGIYGLYQYSQLKRLAEFSNAGGS